MDRELNVCGSCGRPGLKYCPPPLVSHERARQGFERMREAVEDTETLAPSGGKQL